ncbi:hypothetical protein VTJ83DRAFT_3773 [Remersonia thermophila]|uniref:Cyanovirin-N domain-containing protein n=1 Tax=Remersonia thermophila TaxID=72144 RepID=A0ABR4DF11_9PEZI
MKSALSLLLLGIGAFQGAMAANFISSCDASSVKVNGRTLQANCRNIFGQLTCSKLDLTKCLKNVSGSLQADPTGAGPHLDQCVKCTNGKPDGALVIGDPVPQLLYCQCNPGGGVAQSNWPTAAFDLNTIVDNSNGVLECYKTRGTAC